jgi:exodeoxyribonuclease VII small subunit
MAEKSKSYQQLKQELDGILARIESEDVDIDEAAKLYKKAEALITYIEEYLREIKASIDTAKPKR